MEQYTFEQVCEVMCAQNEEAAVPQQELEKIDEQSAPLKLQMGKAVLEQLQNMKGADVENLSSNILEYKFKKHSKKIEYSSSCLF